MIRTPLIANLGGGVDSSAMLVEMTRRGIKPDYIMFADTGSEKPETYDWVARFSDWLVENGIPAVTWVRRPKSRPSKTGPGYTSLEGNCRQNSTIPSLAFGRKSCSLKWKAVPMDKHLSMQPDIQRAWAAGVKPIKLIGFDCSPADSRRSGKTEDDSYQYAYPLRDWGWTRSHCIEAIKGAGLEVPPKSACFFCPASKPEELRELSRKHPELFERALAMEDQAKPHLKTIRGLGRNWSWRDWAEKEGLATATR